MICDNGIQYCRCIVLYTVEILPATFLLLAGRRGIVGWWQAVGDQCTGAVNGYGVTMTESKPSAEFGVSIYSTFLLFPLLSEQCQNFLPTWVFW